MATKRKQETETPTEQEAPKYEGIVYEYEEGEFGKTMTQADAEKVVAGQEAVKEVERRAAEQLQTRREVEEEVATEADKQAE